MKIAYLEKNNRYLTIAAITLICSLPHGAFAAGPPVPSEMSNSMAQILLLIIGALLLAIVMLAQVVIGAAEVYTQRYKETKKNESLTNAGKLLSVVFFCLLGSAIFAADASTAATAANTAFGGLSSISFYTLLSVIGLELIILLALLYNLKILLAKEVAITASTVAKPSKFFDWGKWWEKINSFRPAHEEANIDLGHDYDGIRELDNRLPPWWIYGFYLSILFAGIYLWRFHVAHTAPLSHEELQIALNEAAADKEAYLKKSANKVDENTIVYLADAPSLDAGKKIFSTTCIACHLVDGGGLVGPNLTDDYWLHGGSIKDIFKTIKYGWPEKGMKSWQEDYSPVQIAQLASYVKSLKGTKPAKPKEPQGILYEEAPTAVHADSAKLVDAARKPANTNQKE